MTDEPRLPDPTPPDPEGGATPTPEAPLTIVGLGGSAGALDGYERFFLSLPPDGDMAFVVTPHLDPKHHGLMPEILQRCTHMPVVQIKDGLETRPNHVYVIPPGHSLSIMNGMLLLDDIEEAKGRVIDHFFESLAADQGERAVGVILSGMGSDGTRGVQAIRDHFGMVLVQDPRTAEYPAMPQSAAATQLANDVLPPDELALRLFSFVTRARTLRLEDLSGEGGQPGAPLQRILRLVRVQTGHDFSGYKRSTLVRRIDRRMKSQRIEDISQYIRKLQESPAETTELFRDFTINVTSFFRDVEAFDDLKEQLRSYILNFKEDLSSFRVWVAGCSTGEEAYSVAMVLRELTDELRDRLAFKVQIFATDIDDEAVMKARYGLYPADITYIVTPERLKRFFEPRDGGYQVRAEIRDLVVFATHNTFGDPPFTRLDLLCCRNMLIYLNTELQSRVMAVFQYALRPKGLLFLGASETVGPERDRFSALSMRWKIYQRGDGAPGPLPIGEPLTSSPLAATVGGALLPVRAPRAHDLSQQAQTTLLAYYAPPAVVVNEVGDVLFVNGRTGRYLELPSGQTHTNLFEMARDGLRFELTTLLRQASLDGREVQRSGLQVEVEGVVWTVDVSARPLHGSQPGLLLVVFQERQDGVAAARGEKSDQVLSIERELQHSREALQATVEEMAVSVEELKSTNEELQTTNEELQSSNEELTTSKEELQSMNEELTTINAEHQRVIQDLAQANDDMKNLLESAGIATVFLANDLTIKRFTPRITRVINLMPVDVGRPITDISANLRYEHLTRDIARVLDTLEAYEVQVQTFDNQWYLMRVSPYRTSDNFIDGVVVAFTNIDLIKTLEERLRVALAYAEAVLNSMQDPLVVLDENLRVVTANRAMHDLLRSNPAQLRGERLDTVGGHLLDQPELQQLMRDVVATEQPLSSYVLDLPLPGLGARKMKIEAEPVSGEGAQGSLFLLKFEDVTALMQRTAEEGAGATGDMNMPPEADGED